MKAWQYKTTELLGFSLHRLLVDSAETDLAGYLNTEGALGWELIEYDAEPQFPQTPTIISARFLFKRRVG